MKLIENFKSSIIISAKELQFNEHYLIMDALAVFLGGIPDYYGLFIELLNEAKRKINDDPMFSYILSLMTYYILCTGVRQPNYSVDYQIKNDKIQVEFEDTPNILITDEGMHFVPYTDGTKLLVKSLETIFKIRYFIVNNTNFLDEAKKIETIEDAQHLLFKYIDLIPEDEFIQILYSILSINELKLTEQEVDFLKTQINSNKIWEVDKSILDSTSGVIGSWGGTFAAFPSGSDQANFHPLSRLFLIRSEIGLCDYFNMWQVSFLLEIARLYGTKFDNSETAYRYYNNANETFEDLVSADGEYEKERLTILKKIKEWAELENIFSNRIKSLLSVGAFQAALLDVQHSKSQKLIAELREKYQRDIPTSSFQQEAFLLREISKANKTLSRQFHYSESGKPLDKQISSEHEEFSWKQVSNHRDDCKAKLAQVYSRIQAISPEYIALKDTDVTYPEILKLLNE